MAPRGAQQRVVHAQVPAAGGRQSGSRDSEGGQRRADGGGAEAGEEEGDAQHCDRRPR